VVHQHVDQTGLAPCRARAIVSPEPCHKGHDGGAAVVRYRYFFFGCRTACPGTGIILQSRMVETTIELVCNPEWLTPL